MKLTYSRSGNADAPAIVFLHGMAMGQWMWHEQMRHFADYDCVNIDLPGHGGSHQIAWESFDHAADCVAQLIAADFSTKPVYLIGLSLGAVVGLHLISRYPQRIKRAVLTGAFAEAAPRWQMSLQGVITSALLRTRTGRRLFARTLKLPAEVMPDYETGMSKFSLPSFRRMIDQIGRYTLPHGLNAVTTPVLIVTGAKDVPLNRRSVPALAQRLPESVGVYAPGVHHTWNSEDPALFNETARAWIEKRALPERLIPAASAL